MIILPDKNIELGYSPSTYNWQLVRGTYVVDGRFFGHLFWKVEGTVRTHIAHMWDLLTCGGDIHVWKLLMCGGDIHLWELLTCGGDIHVWELLTCGGDIHMWELLMCGGDIHVWELLMCGGDVHVWELLTCVGRATKVKFFTLHI